MTENAAVYRPSPRPRPAGAPQRPSEAPKLHVVPTQSDDATCSADPAGAPAERETPVSAVRKLQSVITAGSDRVNAAVASTTAYWTPPAVFTDKPASLAELAAYARHATWTAQPYIAKPYTDEHTKKQIKTGAVRAAGIWYYRTVAYPYTVVSRYVEWFVQRPLRLAALLGIVKLTASTSPGIWVVDHLAYPAARTCGHLFL